MAILPVGIGSAEEGGYQIERSLRFNSPDSAYLSRTPASAGNRKTWTWSGWVKRAKLSADMYLFEGRSTNDNRTFFRISGGNTLIFSITSADWLETAAVFRDPSAWYHIVYAFDTTQATQTNRVKLYVNGVQQTITATFGTGWPTQNADYFVNGATGHTLGSWNGGIYWDGYLTEINFIDGSALDPTSFGEFNTDTGVWQPKAYTGSYGTNGFRLSFSNNSGVTSTTLGADSSGNGNNWTPNNFSVTAGAGNDSLVDTPTNYGTDTGVGGEVRGNYATWNPLDKNSNGSLVNGNLDNSNGSQNNAGVRSTFALPSSGKWYAELRVNSNTGATVALGFGFATASADLAGSVDSANKYVIYGSSSGSIFSNTSTITSGLGAFSSGDILQIAYDGATGKAWLGKNNTWYNSSGGTTGNPGAGTNQTFTLTGEFFLYSYYFNVSGSLNAGQRPFAYTAPSGFKALCTQNLPEPTIVDGGEYFGTLLWSGDGTSGRTIATGQSGVTGNVDFTPDLAWIKSRSNATNHLLTDILRGGTAQLRSNTTDAESQFGDVNLTFVNGGFTNAGSSSNESGRTFVAWNWKANGAGVSNTAGTITSTVSANTDSGFSIVTYAGNSTAAATVGHGLGVTPSMVIIKNRTGAYGWVTRHISLSATQNIALQNTDGAYTVSSATSHGGVGTLTSTTFSFISGTVDLLNSNETSNNYVAYCFAAIPGYSAFGSYTGNGSADGPFVYTGFRPAFILYKSTSTSQWGIFDDARNTYNAANLLLQANTSNAEGDNTATYDFLSNGFKVRIATFEPNKSGETYIYMAFAENPVKYSLGR